MTPEEVKKVKINLLWELIQDFQGYRLEEGCDIDEVVLTYNDVEIAFYEKMDEIEPPKNYSSSENKSQ